MSLLSGQAHQTQAIVILISRIRVRVLDLTLVFFSKTLIIASSFRCVAKAVDPMLYVMHVKEHTLLLLEKGSAPVFLAVAAECARAHCTPYRRCYINRSHNSKTIKNLSGTK